MPEEVYKRYARLFYKSSGGSGIVGVRRACAWYNKKQRALDWASRPRPKTTAERAAARAARIAGAEA